MENKEMKNMKKAYDEVQKIHPGITDERQLELLTRKYIFDKKKKSIGATLLLSVIFIIIFAVFPQNIFSEDINNSVLGLTLGASSILGLIGFCRLAKLLHNPLTLLEAQELKEYERLEKTGKPYGEE